MNGQVSQMRQVNIYTKKCFRIFFNERGWKIFISAAIITLIIISVTGEDIFKEYNDTRSGAFALVCACIWIGIFNSIQSICKERDIIKREYRSGLSIFAYVTAHAIFEMVLCAIESIIVTLLLVVAYDLPDDGVIFPGVMELYITFFVVIFASDILGLMISCIVKTPTTAMTVMPFVLILQLVMSGLIFPLDGGISEIMAKFTISKWGLNAICVTSNVNDLTSRTPRELNLDYEFTVANLAKLWAILLLFVFVYYVISVLMLRMVDKDKR